MSMVNPVVLVTPFVPTAASVVAFEQCKAEIEAMLDGPLAPTNVDMSHAARVFQTIAGNVATHKAALLALGIDEIERLALRAQALTYAHSLHCWTLDSPPSVDSFAAPVSTVRKLLLTELELLELRGVIKKGALKLQGTTGYLAMAEDVRTIASAFLLNWDKVGSHLGGDIQKVNDAIATADRLVTAMAETEEIQEKLKGTTAMRAAAWTLALRSYHQINRGIGYIRYYDGDAGELVPSPFDRRSGIRKKGEDSSVDNAAGTGTSPTAPTAPLPTNGQAQPVNGQANIPPTPVRPTTPFEQ